MGTALGAGARTGAPPLPLEPLSVKQMMPMSSESMLRPMTPSAAHTYLVRVRV